jgi:hypothetical protein
MIDAKVSRKTPITAQSGNASTFGIGRPLAPGRRKKSYDGRRRDDSVASFR